MDKIRKNKLKFGIAGIPTALKDKNYINGLKNIYELGLEGFELPFGRFINMSEETATHFHNELQIINNSNKNKFCISVHASYFINLNADDNVKKNASIDRIINCAQRGNLAGAENIIFHPGFYLKNSNEESYIAVSESIKILLDKYYANNEAESLPMLRPETTGKSSQFGTLDELIRLSLDFKQILPCIDFAHLHARNGGKINTYIEFDDVLKLIEDKLGIRGIKNLHIHYSGIEYNKSGERKHLKFSDSDANFMELLRALKDHNAEGMVICESPDLENDALILQNAYLKI